MIEWSPLAGKAQYGAVLRRFGFDDVSAHFVCATKCNSSGFNVLMFRTRPVDHCGQMI